MTKINFPLQVGDVCRQRSGKTVKIVESNTGYTYSEENSRAPYVYVVDGVEAKVPYGNVNLSGVFEGDAQDECSIVEILSREPVLKLVAGNFYKTRAGKKVELFRFNDGKFFYVEYGSVVAVQADGRKNEVGVSDRDIVELWTDVIQVEGFVGNIALKNYNEGHIKHLTIYKTKELNHTAVSFEVTI